MIQSAFANEPAIRLGFFVGIFAVMALWEVVTPRRPRAVSRWIRWPSNLGVVALNTVLLRILIPIAAVGLALVADERGWGFLNHLGAPDWLAIPLAVVVLDFAIYLQHVMFHAVPVLWRLHRMHHADLDFDVTTGARFHPIEILLSMAIKLAVVAALGKANLPPAIVTGGGTGTHRLDAGHGTLGELQAGSYLFMDVQYLSVEQSADGGQPYRPALFVQASVVNVNHPRYAVTDAGLKSFATDGPAPLLAAGAPAGASYRYMGDEHGAVVFADPGDALELGAKVECVVPHCDPNVNLFDHYHVVQGDRLVDIWPVAARGNP